MFSDFLFILGLIFIYPIVSRFVFNKNLVVPYLIFSLTLVMVMHFAGLIYTPIILATKQGNQSLANLLIKCGADVNARSLLGFPILFLAIRDLEEPDIALSLIDSGADVSPFMGVAWGNKTTLLMAAIRGNKTEIVEKLIEKGADVNEHSHCDTVGYLTNLVAAIKNDNIQIIKQLLDAGADPNAFSEGRDENNSVKPIELVEADSEIFQLLINYGAND